MARKTQIAPIQGEQLDLLSVQSLLCDLYPGDTVEVRQDGELFGCYCKVKQIDGDRITVSFSNQRNGTTYKRIELALVSRGRQGHGA